jgi:hypothetical protein
MATVVTMFELSGPGLFDFGKGLVRIPHDEHITPTSRNSVGSPGTRVHFTQLKHVLGSVARLLDVVEIPVPRLWARPHHPMLTQLVKSVEVCPMLTPVVLYPAPGRREGANGVLPAHLTFLK